MKNKTQPSKIYTTININNHGSGQEEYDTKDEQTNCNQSEQWKEQSIVIELFHIIKTSVHQTTLENHPTNKLNLTNNTM
jgi:hypothetical protein